MDGRRPGAPPTPGRRARRAIASPDTPVRIVSILPSSGHLGVSQNLVEVAHSPDGGLWVPSERGVTRVDPALFAQQFAPPLAALVEAVRTEEGEAVAPGTAVPLGARTLTIEYTALDLLEPDLVRFRTRLVGHRDDWAAPTKGRAVTYGGLGPGTYTFEVQASGAGGTWGPTSSLTITVPAHVYETGWFALLALLVLGALVALAVRARLRVLTDRQHELEATVMARTADLAAEKETVAAQAEDLKALDRAKSQLFANVSHEFRTPLTLSIGPLRDMIDGRHGEVGDLRPHLDGVLLNNRRLLRMVNQLLDAARLESHTMERALTESTWRRTPETSPGRTRRSPSASASG